MDSNTIAVASLGISLLLAFYVIFATTPKEWYKRLSKVEVDAAESRRDYAALVKTVDRLAAIVDRYIEFRMETNGRDKR